MELTLDRGGDRPKLLGVKKRLKDANRRPIRLGNKNPILSSIMYEFEYCDRYVTAMAANVIAENLFAQIYQEGNIFLLIDYIIDTRTDGTPKLQQDVFVVTNNGTKRRKIQLKDGKCAPNGRMAGLHQKNLKISRICIQYKRQSTWLII